MTTAVIDSPQTPPKNEETNYLNADHGLMSWLFTIDHKRIAILYLISVTIAGSYNVGTGETYPSLTNPGGIFEAINNGEVNGNVTIEITSDVWNRD